MSYYSLIDSLVHITIRYDIPLLQAVQAAVTVPVIASSGAGKGAYCTHRIHVDYCSLSLLLELLLFLT